jgi:hypothetical protein
MATDEERLAALKTEEQKTQFFTWLDEWFEKKKTELTPEDPPKRTKQEGNGGGFLSLFGG